MIRLLTYLISKGVVTQKAEYPRLEEHCQGLPSIVAGSKCQGSECNQCVDICPTNAIEISGGKEGKVGLDLGKCIACGLCLSACPEDVFARNLQTDVARSNRSDLVLGNAVKEQLVNKVPESSAIFKKSLAVRVISTGCSACDLEIAAAGNPIFDMERYGISLVASPRMADALIVTGPVPKGMHEAVLRTYEAMPEPRIVIACGTCAISGGVHANGYAEANGLSAILPVDVFIPGCPPHPWSIIHGIRLAMGHVETSLLFKSPL